MNNIRPIVSADLVLNCVRTGQNKITLAMIHPDDERNLSEETIQNIKMKLKVSSIMPSAKVERGWLFIETQVLK